MGTRCEISGASCECQIVRQVETLGCYIFLVNAIIVLIVIAFVKRCTSKNENNKLLHTPIVCDLKNGWTATEGKLGRNGELTGKIYVRPRYDGS